VLTPSSSVEGSIASSSSTAPPGVASGAVYHVTNAVLSDTVARTFLHEIDHLNGVLYVDRVMRASDWLPQSEMDRLLASIDKQQSFPARVTNFLSSFFPNKKRSASGAAPDQQ
jgi:hypothetical protein